MQTFPDTDHSTLRSSAVSDRGLSDKRPHNEDSYLDMPQLGIFAVADGVGGAEAGEVASQMAVEILSEAFSNRSTNSDAEMVMRIALERANAAIHQMSNDLSQLSKMATTIAALHVEDTVATIAHAGDSRVYRLRPDGSLIQETQDHSMVADEVRAGRMTEEQAESHPGKNIINRALGAESFVEIDLKTIMIEPGSMFLLCSDGITRHIPDEEIRAILLGGRSTDDICIRLKEVCFERGAEDNLTAVVVQTISSKQVEPPVAAESESDILALPDTEEDTLASARPSLPSDDDLLEIEEKPIDASYDETFLEGPTITPDTQLDDTIRIEEPGFDQATNAEPSQQVVEQDIVPNDAPTEVPFAETKPAEYEPEPLSLMQDEPSTLGRFAAYAAILVLGSLIGIGVYHFALRQPTPSAPATDQLTEMRSQNVALGAFEDNRRAVDADPAKYLATAPAPGDAEDLYLIARAQLLSGDFVKARASILEAQKRISEADPKNRKVIESDIALFLSLTNDTTSQSVLKKELEASKAVGNTATTPKR